jgi:8-oxo-dGTP pyrophosphatase MutT (NUDIX family)
MPIHKVSGGWQWGEHGKVYPNRAGAEKQAEAAHANGYTGDLTGATGAGVALRAPTGRLLFLKRSDKGDHPGEWCFPGGGVEQGESTTSAASRELYEESGITAEGGPEGIVPIDRKGTFVTYAGEAKSEIVPTLNDEHTAYAWAHPWNAPQPLHPGVTETLTVLSPRIVTHDFAGYFAPEKIGKTRRVTPEGFLVLVGTPIARIGQQIYRAGEIDGIEADGAGNIIVERLPEEVFHPDSLASLEGKDYVINHPPKGVDITNWKQFSIGHAQNVRRGEGIEDDLVVADIIVKDPEGIVYVNKHLPENSVGYNADYEQVCPGRAIQRNIIGNHVAAVMAGRAGARVAVRDNLPIEEPTMSKKTFWGAFREKLTTLGVRTEDAAALETELRSTTLTVDAEGEGAHTSNLVEQLSTMSKDMKGIKDWMAARDARDAEEEKKTKDAESEKKKEEEKAAKDAEAKKNEYKEKEETGDTILEAEGPGEAIVMGKLWKGTMTGDSASQEPVYSAVVARAEIIAPGIPKPTEQALKGNGGKVLAKFMQDALTQHAQTAPGKVNVNTFTTDAISTLKGHSLVGVFNGVAQIARARNNTSTTTVAAVRGVRTGDFSKPITPAELNKRNADHWDKLRSKS